MLAMYGGQIAVFAVQDMLLFFLVWELELVPVYLILSIWGGKKRLYIPFLISASYKPDVYRG